MLCVKETCVREDLVDVRSVGAAFLVLKLSPPPFVEFSEVGLVFGIDHVNVASALEHEVWHELRQRSIGRLPPPDRKRGFTEAADANRRARHPRLRTIVRFYVVLPQHFERE